MGTWASPPIVYVSGPKNTYIATWPGDSSGDTDIGTKALKTAKRAVGDVSAGGGNTLHLRHVQKIVQSACELSWRVKVTNKRVHPTLPTRYYLGSA